MGGGKLVWMFDGVAPVGGPPPAFAPTDIPGLVLWLDANQISGLANADPVVTWNDLSGQGNHVTQATGAKQPTYRTNQINGLPVVRGDGVDDVLIKTGPAGLTSSQGDLFAVYKRTVGNNGTVFASADASSPDHTIYFPMLGASGRASVYQLEVSGNDNLISTTTVIDTTNFHLVEWSSNGSAYTIRINGTSESLIVVLGANTGGWFDTVTSRDSLSIFAHHRTLDTEFMTGDMPELLLYNTQLSAGNRTLVNAYFATKYGLVIA